MYLPSTLPDILAIPVVAWGKQDFIQITSNRLSKALAHPPKIIR